jgi:hypothetical protein
LTTKSIGGVEFLPTKSKYIIRYTFLCKWILLGYFYIFHTPKFGLEFLDEVNSPDTNEEMTKIKFVDLKKLYKFIVENFFI